MFGFLALAAMTMQDGAIPKGVERSDANSHLAHKQLVQKAKAGRIDTYFLGDSITRRWGCTDPAWAHLFENWKKHFTGWNAGNFGWGADCTENILWRIQNGELDGVNPKVVVLLAGTNDIGTRSDDPEVAEKTYTNITYIVREVQQKAPDARIVLTAVFPRIGTVKVTDAVKSVNLKLEAFAKTEKLFFVDLTKKISNEDGSIKPGMLLPDGLHAELPTYDAWANELIPIFKQVIGKPSDPDLAPPATGDPSAVPAHNS